jgi:hypothetical protein
LDRKHLLAKIEILQDEVAELKKENNGLRKRSTYPSPAIMQSFDFEEDINKCIFCK